MLLRREPDASWAAGGDLNWESRTNKPAASSVAAVRLESMASIPAREVRLSAYLNQF
jgi:hypothetical protein